MQNYNIVISEDQLRLIRNACQFTVAHSGSTVEKDREELQLIADMIEDVVDTKDIDTIHGFCY